MHRAYDEAEALVITASHPALGAVRLRCERDFSPLRWSAGTDRDGPFIRLIDNTDTGPVQIERYAFATPTKAATVEAGPESVLHWPDGGLFRATTGNYSAAVVLPPHVRDWTDLQRTNITPSVPSGPRTASTAMHLIELAKLWAEPALPADPFATAECRRVQRGITVRLVSTIGGQRWTTLEDRCAGGDEYPLDEFRAAIGDESYQRALADAIQRGLPDWLQMEPTKRGNAFAVALAAHGHRAGVGRDDGPLAELLLRLASEPASVSGSLDELTSVIDLALVSPVLMRAARFLVLAIHCSETEDVGTTYRGWAWA